MPAVSSRTKLREVVRPARLALILLALSLAAPDVAAAGGALGPGRSGCHFSGTTIDAGPGGRVFYRPTRDPDRVYLCSYRTGRRTPIGSDDCFNAVEVQITRFSRRFLAVDTRSCAPGGTASTLYLYRTRNGRRVRGVADVPGPFTPGAVSDVTDLVLRGDGALAWIVGLRDTVDSGPRYQVRASLGGTVSTLVAEGSDIAPGSLALAGSTLYWTQAGAPHSTRLPGQVSAGR